MPVTSALHSERTTPATVVALSATTPAAAAEMHERVYGSGDVRFGTPGRGRFIWRYRTVGDDEVTFGTSISSVPRRGMISAGDDQVFSWTGGDGRVVLWQDAEEPLAVTTAALTRYAGGAPLRFEAHPTVKHFLRISNAYLRAVSAAHRSSDQALDWARQPASVGPLRSTIETLAPRLLDPDLDPEQRAFANASIAWAVIDAYSSVSSTPLSGGRATLRRPQEWIVANAWREEAYDVVRWVQEFGFRHGWDGRRLFLSGIGAGSKLAINVCQQLHTDGGTRPLAVSLIVPVTDMTRTDRTSPVPRPAISPFVQRLVSWAYFPDADRRREPLAAPRYDPALPAAMPPTIIQTGEFDTLRPEGKELADTLSSNGVDVVYNEYREQITASTPALRSNASTACSPRS